jgi:dihydroorotase
MDTRLNIGNDKRQQYRAMAGKFLFRQLKVVDPTSPYNRKKIDILVENGVIRRIGKDLRATKSVTVDCKGFSALPGFCDLYADFCDPGFEHREDILSGIKAAAAGGYTTVCLVPHTHPVIQSKSGVEYIIHHSEGRAVTVLPLGAVSEDLAGKNPTEMYDMHHAGAAGFTDAPYPVANSGLLLRALQYVQPFNGIVFDMAVDKTLSAGCHVSEGEISVRMGLKGIPHMAEVVQLKRNIEILRYAGGRLHMYGITTREGVDLIKKARQEGLDISASAFVHHLLFTHDDVASYDSNLKSMPPFRSRRDRRALIKGLQDGVIDAVVTQHSPLEIEEKKTEFEYAGFGMTGLETAFSEVVEAFDGKPSLEDVARWMSINPRRTLGLEPATIVEGAGAEFTVVDPRAEWEYTAGNRRSKSLNSPHLGRTLQGRVIGIANNGTWTPNE